VARALRLRAAETDEPDERTTFVDEAIKRVVRAHAAARSAYLPRVYPGRIVLFRPGTLSARHFGDPYYGWGGLARDGIEVHEIPANTPALVDEPTVRVLAERLRSHLGPQP